MSCPKSQPKERMACEPSSCPSILLHLWSLEEKLYINRYVGGTGFLEQYRGYLGSHPPRSPSCIFTPNAASQDAGQSCYPGRICLLTSARGPYSSIFYTLGSVLRLSLVPSLRISSCDTWGLQSRWRLNSVLVTGCAY